MGWLASASGEGSGSWTGATNLGVRRWLSFEAEDVLADEVKERRQAAPPVVDPNITLTDWSQRWLDQLPAHLASSTVASYRETLTRYIRPELGTSRLQAAVRAEALVAGQVILPPWIFPLSAGEPLIFRWPSASSCSCAGAGLPRFR